MEILAQNPTEKFLLLQSLESYLQKTGLSPAGASAFTLLATFAVLALLVWVLDRLGTKVLLGLIRHAVSKTETLWDDHLLRHKFFPRLIELATAGGLLALVRTVFSGYGPALIGAITLVLRVYMTVVGALMIGALLNTVNDIYESKPQSRRKSIRGYIQTAKIVVWIIAGILIVSILIGKSPAILLTGLGASAAVIMLVFRDSILGFVSGIQLSANDMLKVGDWITVPKYGADGSVIEVSLTTVKVQNWDNTIVTLPPYLLVSDSFQNWRGMQASGGRRVKRSVNLDMTSVKFCTPDMLARYRNIDIIREYIDQTEQRVEEYNAVHGIRPGERKINGLHQTNLGVFRAYLERYLRDEVPVNKGMTLMVRQLQPTETGLPMELYFFTDTVVWVDYERIQSDIFDHFFAMVPKFQLKVYQYSE